MRLTSDHLSVEKMLDSPTFVQVLGGALLNISILCTPSAYTVIIATMMKILVQVNHYKIMSSLCPLSGILLCIFVFMMLRSAYLNPLDSLISKEFNFSFSRLEYMLFSQLNRNLFHNSNLLTIPSHS